MCVGVPESQDLCQIFLLSCVEVLTSEFMSRFLDEDVSFYTGLGIVKNLAIRFDSVRFRFLR